MNRLTKACARVVFGKLLPQLPYPVMRGPLKGARFILGALAGECGGASVYFNMIEQEQTLTFVNTLKQGQILFDIGANVGYYTILGARTVGPRGRVVAFEPAVRNVSYLYRHTMLNRASNVTIIPAACSDSLSLATFAAGPNFATGRVSDRTGSNADADRLMSPVATATVDAVVDRLGVSPHAMKIDVEGAEELVLRGAQVTLQRAKPKIFLSTHSSALRTTCLE